MTTFPKAIELYENANYVNGDTINVEIIATRGKYVNQKIHIGYIRRYHNTWCGYLFVEKYNPYYLYRTAKKVHRGTFQQEITFVQVMRFYIVIGWDHLHYHDTIYSNRSKVMEEVKEMWYCLN
jgi:hypothetical protein